jgi:hypothetical protein
VLTGFTAAARLLSDSIDADYERALTLLRQGRAAENTPAFLSTTRGPAHDLPKPISGQVYFR